MRQITSSQFVIEKSKTANRKSSILVWCLAFLLLGTLPGGCSSVSSEAGSQRQQLSYEEELSTPYDQIMLKKSLTLDALPKIKRTPGELESRFAGSELLSHSENVVASLGQSKDGRKTWFNMVTFHEYRLNVIRKYFFVVDDKARSLRAGLGRGLRFDCEMVLEKGILDESYASENARQIAMLRHVLNNVREDINELGADVDAPGQNNKMLNVCGMLINQALETILLKLDSSPVLATGLSEPGGVEFDHINFGRGTAEMVVGGDTVAVKIRFGAFAHAM
ncbi:MAG: hypothetical protein PVJ86_13325 [Phycisphaerales bacterium]